MEFIDDYRLLVGRGHTQCTPPSLVLVETKGVVRGVPARTVFHLPHPICQFGWLSILLERGAHKPSPEEYFAPFHKDPTQLIAALALPGSFGYLVFPVRVLLGFLESHGGSEVEWNEWKSHVASANPTLDTWVSGCRLFLVTASNPSQSAEMMVFDFSMQGRMKYLSEETDAGVTGIRRLLPTNARARIPWPDLVEAHGGHDSITLVRVRVISLHFLGV